MCNYLHCSRRRKPWKPYGWVGLRERWRNPPAWFDRVDGPGPGYPRRPAPPDEDTAKALKRQTLTNLHEARPPNGSPMHTAPLPPLWPLRTVGLRTLPTRTRCASCRRSTALTGDKPPTTARAGRLVVPPDEGGRLTPRVHLPRRNHVSIPRRVVSCPEQDLALRPLERDRRSGRPGGRRQDDAASLRREALARSGRRVPRFGRRREPPEAGPDPWLAFTMGDDAFPPKWRSEPWRGVWI